MNNLVQNMQWIIGLLGRMTKSRTTLIKRPDTSQQDNQNPKKKSMFSSFSSMSLTRLSIKEQTFFAKRMSFLNKAGVPTLEGLHMLREQAKSKSFIKILDRVISDFSSGQFLSTSLGRFDHIFGNFAIHIIKVGETSGTLSQNLDYLAEELQKKQVLRRKIFGAFLYPGIITVATFGITGFLMIYLFPKILPIFSSLHMKLPLSTRIVMWSSQFLQDHGLAVLAALAAIIIGSTVLIKKVPRVRFMFDAFLLRIPIVGQTTRYYNLTNICRTLGLLLHSGIAISEAIPITADTTENLVYKKELHQLAAKISQGERMSTYLRSNTRLFPDVVGQMVAVGEKSGSLSNSLLYISELFENDVNEFTKNLSTLIEPILMIFMGVLVGFIAISIITPIYAITQNLHN